jgi:hypothetical protein
MISYADLRVAREWLDEHEIEWWAFGSSYVAQLQDGGVVGAENLPALVERVKAKIEGGAQ